MTFRPARVAFSLLLVPLAIAAAGCRGARLPERRAAAPAVAAAPRATAPAARPSARTAAPMTSLPVPAPSRRPGAFDAQDVPLEQALAEARRQHRPVAILFVTSWCGWCRRLERDTLPDAGVRAELAHWYVVRYDADRGAGKAAAERYGVHGFPTVTLLDSAGAPAGEAAGYSEPSRFAEKLRSARH
jgi:thiol:disulfide interchange protein